MEYSRQNTPTFRIVSSLHRNQLTTVSMLPIQVPTNVEEDATRFAIHAGLRRYIAARMRETFQWTFRQTMNRISGVLIARNYDTDSSVSKRSLANLNQLTPDLIANMMEAISESQRETDLYDLQWELYIDPASFSFGASHVIKKPAYVTTKVAALSWKSYSDDRGPICCAAIACVIALEPRPDNFVRHPDMFVKKARSFQTKMGWGNEVNFNHFRIFAERHEINVVIVMNGVRDYNPWSFGTGPRKFFYFDAAQSHWAYLSVPIAFVKHLLGMPNIT